MAEHVGVDLAPVVMTNPTTTRNAIITNALLPIEDPFADVVIADWVFEHIADPDDSPGKSCVF